MKNAKIIYELSMLSLILTSLIGLFYSDHPVFTIIHRVVYVVFLLDFITRVIKSVSKFKYIYKHPFDLISIIPLEEFMLLARFGRFLRFFRYKTLLKRYLSMIHRQVSKMSLLYVTVSVVVFLSALTLYYPPGFVITHVTNFTSDIEQYPVMAVILKTIGILYVGLLINKGWMVLKWMYQKYIKRKAGDDHDK